MAEQNVDYQVVLVGHKSPAFKPRENHVFLGSIAPGNVARSVFIDDETLGHRYSGRLISEYLQLFCYFLESDGPSDKPNFVYIYQYRKFLSRIPGSRSPRSMPYLYGAYPFEVDSRNLDEAYLDQCSKESRIAVGPILSVGAMASNYAKFHIIEDFVAFCVAMQESNLFTASQITEFINFPLLIPTPSVGFHDLKTLKSDLTILATVWGLFYVNSFRKRDGYQRRVGGFLLERLHSFLLIRRLSGGVKYDLCFQFIVTENGDAIPSL